MLMPDASPLQGVLGRVFFVLRVGFCLGFCTTIATATPAASSFTLEWPLPVGRAVPSWLGEVEETSDGIGSSLRIPLRVPEGGRDLLVTLFFLDEEGGFVRLIWDGSDSQTMLAINLKEEVGTFHQRTVVIEAATLGDGGILVIGASEPDLPIQAVRLEWVTWTSVRVTDSTGDIGAIRGETLLAEADLQGSPEPSRGDVWQDWIIDASLTQGVEAIEQGLAFEVPLEATPSQARLSLLISGLRPDTFARVAVNGAEVAALSVELPDLIDDGHRRDDVGKWFYAGWRRAVAHVPPHVLEEGHNELQIVWDADAQGLEPVSVKRMTLQLRYDPPQEEVSHSELDEAASFP